MIEFTSKDRPQIDDRFSGIGNAYSQAKASRMGRPFAPAPRDHKATVKASTKPTTGPSTKVRAFKVKVDALLAEPVTEPARPRRTTRAGKHFRLADLYRQAGQYAESQRHEKAGDLAGRALFLAIIAQQAVTKAGGHHGRR